MVNASYAPVLKRAIEIIFSMAKINILLAGILLLARCEDNIGAYF